MHLSHHILAAWEALRFLSRESSEFVILSKQKWICSFMFFFKAQILQQFCWLPLYYIQIYFFFSTHTICIFFSMLWSVCRADLTGSAHPSQMLFPDNFGVNLEKMHCTCQFLRDENNKCRRWFFPWQNIFSKANRPPKSNRQDTAIFFSYLDKA